MLYGDWTGTWPEWQVLAQPCFWKVQGLYHRCALAGMRPGSVTAASALRARGKAPSEGKIWSLLSLAAEWLLEHLCEGKTVCLGHLSHGGGVWHDECEASQTNTFLGNVSISAQGIIMSRKLASTMELHWEGKPVLDSWPAAKLKTGIVSVWYCSFLGMVAKERVPAALWPLPALGHLNIIRDRGPGPPPHCPLQDAAPACVPLGTELTQLCGLNREG